ncbi:hypothetical protein FRC10_010358, partial [Ceratobasidium sp. 414]
MSNIPLFVINQAAFSVTGNLVCDQLHAARKVTVLCGAGVSVAAGVPDFRSPGGMYSQQFSRNNVKLSGSDLFDVSTIQNADKLAILNVVMTKLRIHARAAPITCFHQLVSRLDDIFRLQRCYTQNFDGLQTRDFPSLASKVFELHGSNDQLHCFACSQQPTDPVSSFDSRFLEHGLVECPNCQNT